MRNAGATASQANRWTSGFDITTAPPSITSLTADHAFPFPADGVTAVTWTAVVSGGVAPLEYQFQRYSVATGLYTVVQNWGTSNTFVWTPTTARQVLHWRLRAQRRRDGVAGESLDERV